jgi:NADH-quinone oxidoreductase subunit H
MCRPGILFFAPPNFLEPYLLRLVEKETLNFVLWPFIQIVLIVTLVAFWALYATYLERKVSAFMQARLGPMRVGPWGLLQPIADAIKLLTKEDLMPERADPYIFRFAPYISVAAAFLTLAVIPFAPDWGIITDLNIGLLFVLSISSVGVLALILAGWSSNSKYSLLGGLRSSAQMVSYEVAMGLSLIGALMFARTLSVSGVVQAQETDSIWFLLYQPVGFVIFFISGIAENNRAPFDLPEAESELVAGFHTEYSGMRWSLFFMAEYAAMVVVAAIATTVYLGGWHFPFVYSLTQAKGYHLLYILISLLVFLTKMGVLLYLYFWFRWTFPRYRYDQLMDLGWKWLIPASLINITLTALSVFLLQALDGNGLRTIDTLSGGLNLTAAGKVLMVLFAIVNIGIVAMILFHINRNSRDFNIRRKPRTVRLVDVARGNPALAHRSAEIKG